MPSAKSKSKQTFTQQLRLNYKLIIGVAALFAVIGTAYLLRSYAAVGNSLEAESATRTGSAEVKTESGTSNNQYVTLNTATTPPPPPPTGGGGIVALPTNNPTGSLVSIPDGKHWGMVSCADADPICAYTWQEGGKDIYIGAYGQSEFCGCVELRNSQTGALVKRVNLMDAGNAPRNGARPYPIYNPFKKQWLVVTQSTRNGWSGGDNIDRPYGFLIDISGNIVGDAFELSSMDLRGWVPHGVFDTATKKYFVEWHQQIAGYNRKDIYATVVDENGAITDKDFNIDQTPNTLDEYATAVYNPDTGEVVSIHSTSGENDCDDCTRYIDVYRLKIDAAGKLAKVGEKTRLDGDDKIEWGIHASYNPVTKSIAMLFREGTTARRGGGLTEVYAVVLDGQGVQKAAPVKVGDTADDYWTTGTACSTKTNLCVGAFWDQALYIDGASTGTTKVSSTGPSGASIFGFQSTRAGYSSVTDKFYLYGSNGYVVAAGQ